MPYFDGEKIMNQQNQFNQTIGYSVENWQPRQKPIRETMLGNYCMLEALDVDLHADKLFEALQVNNNGETWTYLLNGPFASVNEFRNWLISHFSGSDPLLFVILDAKTRQLLGHGGYLRINPEQGSIEVGYLYYSKLLQKTPAATEAMFLMMQKVFDELGYRRYEWKCNALNKASCAAAERLGFKFEGIFRQSHVVKGYNRDTAWYSIIDSEWPALKEKFQKWLKPSNFDSMGNQILKLQDI